MQRLTLVFLFPLMLIGCGGDTPDLSDAPSDSSPDSSDGVEVDTTPPASKRVSIYKNGDLGVVVSDPAGIECGNTCFAEFDHGSQVALRAIPGNGSRFTGFTGACEGVAPCLLDMTENREVGVGWEAHAPTIGWAHRVRGSKDESTTSIAVTPDGRVLVAVLAQSDNVEIDGQSVGDPTRPVVVLASFTPSGTLEWSRSFVATDECAAAHVAVDDQGNTYLFGKAGPETDLSGNMGIPGHGTGNFVARYDSAGALLGFSLFQGGCITAAVVNGGGESAITGWTKQDTAEFGGESHDTIIEATSMFLASFDALGLTKWSRVFATAPLDYAEGNDVLIDGAGEVTVAGFFQNTGVVDFGGGMMPDGSSTVVARYTATGGHLWSHLYGGVYTHVNQILPRKGGGLYVAGFDSKGASKDNFVASWNLDTGVEWQTSFFFQEKQEPMALVRRNDGLVVAGNAQSPYPPFEEIFMAGITGQGVVTYHLLLGGDGQDRIGAMAVTQAGKLVIAGSTSSKEFVLGETSLSAADGGEDAPTDGFIALCEGL